MAYPLTGLQGNNRIRPIYVLPEDPFIKDVLIPSFEVSSGVDCMVGFFTSEVLVSLAPGLATFINQSKGVFRLIISPVLRTDDWIAIKSGVSDVEEVVKSIFDDLLVTENAIEKHTLECLAWLLRHGRIEIQIALMRDGLFHPKVWLFHDDQGQVLCAHGSTNLTAAGMHRNIEQVAVCSSWGDADALYTIRRLNEQFQAFWNNSNEHCIVLPVPDVIREQLVRTYATTKLPQEIDVSLLYGRAAEIAPAIDNPVPEGGRINFHIPSWLCYSEGPFAHQGDAVDAWYDAGCRGVLEMATGAGKTIAAMIAAHRLFQEQRPLLIVVAAPYIPLVQQWCTEIELFGVAPVDLSSANGSIGRGQVLGRLRRSLKNGNQEVAMIVVSHDILTNPTFHEDLKSFGVTTLLIGDEVHGLGSEGFVSNPPEFFNHRLGLSATPVRQYDAIGTDALFEFFGPIVYEFTLEQAIGVCLVPYDYFVHPVTLTDDEMGRWYDLTGQIRKHSWQDGEESGAYLQKLLRDRRAILENAADKVRVLKETLEKEDLQTLRHTLIYASDKAPDQLERVNRTLGELGVPFHQLTYEETSNRKRTKRILQLFQDGELRVLTAKRVLDEGVNIPQIQKAFILASTTVERQWVQRRGRLLRRCDEIGKTYSEIHDFVAMPASLSGLDKDAKKLIESELNRVREFARLSRNAGLPGGALDTISKLVLAAYL